jgi:hypothetical protein
MEALKAFRQYEKNTVACVLAAGWSLDQLTSVSLLACLPLLVSLLYLEKLACLLLLVSLFIMSLLLSLCYCPMIGYILASIGVFAVAGVPAIAVNSYVAGTST